MVPKGGAAVATSATAGHLFGREGGGWERELPLGVPFSFMSG